ncbi:hypothetical protein HY995_00520 [Candidatus Micrarchaeota archaeon]|nr:hypothetical protein [Candidatus Micrarchaeota archaeon]MBI5176551.1 hypothetical protein [Candidatus Micrarchaeota archaeon]
MIELKTLAISEDTHRQLVELKAELGCSSVDEVERTLIVEFKKHKLREASAAFRSELGKSGLTFRQFLKRSEKTRVEIADEYRSRQGSN